MQRCPRRAQHVRGARARHAAALPSGRVSSTSPRRGRRGSIAAMTRRRARAGGGRGGAPRPRGRFRFRASLPRLPLALAALAATGALALADAVWQLARKPTEILGLVAPGGPKAPRTTWSEYGPLFREHSTDVIRPELLAALAQVESAGDPLARTYWRWRWSWNPLEVYGPASSAVGLLQMTDGNLAEAGRLCIRAHAVVREGAWPDPGACRPDALSFRTVPSHAIEMTAAWLHVSVIETLQRARIPRASLEEKERLAAVIHLCGRERGAAYARRGFRARPGERCGDHALSGYLDRVQYWKAAFVVMDGR